MLPAGHLSAELIRPSLTVTQQSLQLWASTVPSQSQLAGIYETDPQLWLLLGVTGDKDRGKWGWGGGVKSNHQCLKHAIGLELNRSEVQAWLGWAYFVCFVSFYYLKLQK